MSRLPITVAVLILLSGCAVAVAQPTVSDALPDLDESLTLQECITLALQRHPSIGLALTSAVSAQANARAQQSLRYPHLQLQWSARETKSLGADRRTGRTAAVSAEYTLYQSGLRERIDRAEVSAESSQYSIAETRQQLTYQVTVAYWGILAAHRYAEVVMDSVANAQRHWDMVRARIDIGVAPEADILPVNVQVAQARLDAVRADTELSVAYADMRALLGLPPQVRFRLADTPEAREEYDADLDSLMAIAEANRPDLASQRLAIRAADLGVRIARAETGVKVTAGASADYGRFTGTTGKSWQLQVGATYPLFDAGASEAQRTSAEADSEAARWRMTALMQDMQGEVEVAHLRISQAAASLDAAEVSLTQARTSLAAAEARYAEGLAIVVEVTDAQLALLQTQVALVQAEYNYVIAAAALDRAVGTQVATTAGDD
jgi:outer membrane protein